jgi:hypothetical protein
MALGLPSGISPPPSPVRSWVGLGVVRGVQLGPWAAGFGGR